MADHDATHEAGRLWEFVDDQPLVGSLYRRRVPGGWLVRVGNLHRLDSDMHDNSKGAAASGGLTFLPDPKHQWAAHSDTFPTHISNKETTMSADKLTVEEVRTKTLELLESEDPQDVEHITQELVDHDLDIDDDAEDDENVADPETSSRKIYGHNMRYSNRRINNRTVQVYVYDRGPDRYSRSDGCKSDYKGRWLRQDQWNHYVDGTCRGRDKRIRFERR